MTSATQPLRVFDPARYDLRAFDLAFCYDEGLVSRAIGWGTLELIAPRKLRLSPSHVAVICDNPFSPSNHLWVESTTLCRTKCVIRGSRVSGCQAHDPADRIADYVDAGGRVDIYRIHPLIRDRFTFETLREDFARMLLEGFVRPAVGYDLRNAVFSGTRFFSLSRWMPWGNLNRVFCSELAAFAEMWLGLLPWENQQRYNPGRLLRHQVRTAVRRLVASYSSEVSVNVGDVAAHGDL